MGFGEISYDDGPPKPAVAVLEYRDARVARETIYVTDAFDAPAWREHWRSAWQIG